MGVTIENPRSGPAGSPPAARLPRRADPVVRRIARDWRRLTSRAGRRLPDRDRRTLLAVSGGADSMALLIALVTATGRSRAGVGGVGHVVHDLRRAEEALADRDAVAEIAARLDLPFFERSVRTDPGANREGSARDARYAALAEMAAESGCPFVATAHHADDQLESVIMALIRGAGPDGLGAIAPRRRVRSTGLESGATLIRPCLNITRAEAEALCRRCDVAWRDDHTNRDTSRLRAALRHGPLADLVAIRPDAAAHAARSAALLRDAAGLIRDHARAVFADSTRWPRESLRGQRRIVLGAGLRAAALRLTGGRHADALTGATVDPVVRAIRDDSTEPRTFDWPGGLTVGVTARQVSIRAGKRPAP